MLNVQMISLSNWSWSLDDISALLIQSESYISQKFEICKLDSFFLLCRGQIRGEHVETSEHRRGLSQGLSPTNFLFFDYLLFFLDHPARASTEESADTVTKTSKDIAPHSRDILQTFVRWGHGQ